MQDFSDLVWSRDRDQLPGCLIVFEGPGGCGKTTQISCLESALDTAGHSVVTTKQPTDRYRKDPFVSNYLQHGGTPEQARSLALFAAADRLMHISETVLPALAAGKIVLCDRYVFSTLVYFNIRRVSHSFVCSINAGVIEPDISFYLSVPPAKLNERLQNRMINEGHKLHLEERSLSTLASINEGFDNLDGHLTIVDGSPPIEDVSRTIADCVVPVLNRKAGTTTAKEC